eukprot:13099504-Alexandrium_andersonii.AAC.1
MLLLRESQYEPLNRHAENIRTLSDAYGPGCWSIIYAADVRMRRQYMERVRRRLQGEAAPGLSRLPSV